MQKEIQELQTVPKWYCDICGEELKRELEMPFGFKEETNIFGYNFHNKCLKKLLKKSLK